jgi:nucleoside-diphosphate-sugar epimerase
MKVFLIGGTGFLGSRVAARLAARGHAVTLLTRSPDRARQQREQGGYQTVVGDILDLESFRGELPPQDVVVFMVMPAFQVGSRITHREFLSLQRVTTAMYANAMELARQLRAVLIATSGASFHTEGADVATEEWPIDRRGLAGLGAGADPLFAEALRTGSPPLVLMLPGQIYGNGGIFRKMMYEWAKQGRNRVIGSGQNCIPRIHVDDCANAYVKAVELLPVGERLIIADDTPCTVSEFSDYLAECMGVRRPGHVPGFLVRLAVGALTYQTIVMNCRVSNARARQVLDWQPAYPSYREGLRAVITEIEGAER